MPFNSRNQRITLWEQSGLSGDGHPTFSAPRVILARWEDRVVLINQGVSAEVLSSNARVYVGEDLKSGDYIFEGVSAEAAPPPNARRVIRFVKIPAVRDPRKVERVAYLD